MNIIRQKIFIPAIGATSLLVVAFFGFSGLLKDGTTNTKYADWMSSLDNNLSLREVNMPGSHDTMALYSIGDFAGQCQSLSLKDQLNLGVRFLDIRLKESGGELKACHSIVDQRATFKSMTRTIESFLDKHQNEFIMLSIKNEADDSNPNFEPTLSKYLNKDIYIKDRALPTKVGDIRGKAVLLSRYQNNTIGVDCYGGWRDSQSFTISDNDIYVQDTYRVTSKEQKQEEIVKCFNEAGHALKINFLSAYRTDQFPPSYAVTTAKDINPWINKEIDKYHDRGIVLYDFITAANMDYFFKGLL